MFLKLSNHQQIDSMKNQFLVTKEKEMCSCLGSSPVIDKDFTKREIDSPQETISLSVSKQIRDISVRIVHAGGRIEMYQKAIPVSKLIQKYPGMCVTRPEVFKRPHESILSNNEMLLPGNKYFIIPSTTLNKLKRGKSRQRSNGNSNCPSKKENTNSPSKIENTNSDEPELTSIDIQDVGDVSSEESIISAKDFYVTKDSWSKCASKKQVKGKKRFVPPIQKPRMWKEPEWEPSLTSIKEVSP